MGTPATLCHLVYAVAFCLIATSVAAADKPYGYGSPPSFPPPFVYISPPPLPYIKKSPPPPSPSPPPPYTKISPPPPSPSPVAEAENLDRGSD
ncbi:hypothetical protein OROMI_016166 [Orobanche minor]